MTFYETLLRRAYDAFNERDIQVAIDTMHADVMWPNAGDGTFMQGRDAVRSYWTKQWSEIDPVVEPQAFASVAGGRVAVTVHQIVHDLGGAVLAEQTVQHVYSFSEGLIKSMEIKTEGS